MSAPRADIPRREEIEALFAELDRLDAVGGQ